MMRLLFLLLSAALLSPTASSAITIDQLSLPQAESLLGVSQRTTSSSVAGKAVLGGGRGLLINKSAAPLSLSVQIGGGLLYYTQDFGITGNSLVSWDGDQNAEIVTPNGLGSVNLLGDEASALRFTVEAADAPIELVFTAYDANDPLGFHYSRGRISISSSISAPTSFELPFSSFTESGLVGPGSFSSVGALTLFISGGTPNTRIALSFIGTNGRCTHIPVHALVVDQCGVCNGNGLSCVVCKTKNQGTLLQSLADGAVKQSDIIGNIIAAYRATAEGKLHPTWASRTLERTRKLRFKNSSLALSFPQRIRSCTNAQNICTHVSYADVTAQYRKRATALNDVAHQALLKLEGIGEISQKLRTLAKKQADSTYKRNLLLLGKVGDSQVTCPKA